MGWREEGEEEEESTLGFFEYFGGAIFHGVPSSLIGVKYLLSVPSPLFSSLFFLLSFFVIFFNYNSCLPPFLLLLFPKTMEKKEEGRENISLLYGGCIYMPLTY